MNRKNILSFLLIFVSVALFAQSGEVSGKVVDEKNQAIPFANISIVENGVPTGSGSTTDFDGFYSIKNLSPGTYDIKFSVIGYTSIIKAGVLVKNDKTTYLDQKLEPSATKIEEVKVIRYKVPLIDAGATSTQTTMTAKDIQNLPTRNVTDIASTTAGVKKKGGELSFRGSRGDAVVYYVDGIRVNGKVNLPVTAIEQLDVVTGGVSSKYGEATGGVINISTKGGARKFSGGIEILESLDRWRYDLINANVSGPIIKNKETNQTILGFAFSAEYNYQLDPSPSSVVMYKVKDSLLASLRESPLYLDEDVVRWRAENLRAKDLEETWIKPNTRQHKIGTNLKFDIRLSDNMKLSIGGGGDYNRNNRRIDKYSLLNAENNPLYQTLSYRGFLRFTHNLKKKATEEGEKIVKGTFQNGYYQAIVAYEKYRRDYEDETHGDNSFAYGYIGSFKTERQEMFNTEEFGYYDLVDYTDANVKFKPSDANEGGANFTTQYYELLGATKDENGYYSVDNDRIKTIDLLDASPGLINGERADIPFGLWYNTGRQYNGHGVDNNNDQFTGTINAGFDILKKGAESRNKHSISLGITFEQRIGRNYTVSPLALWDVARSSVNSHLVLNKDERWVRYSGGDSLVIDGVTPLYMTDTIFHKYHNDVKPNGDLVTQSTFDKNLREKIGAGENDYIDFMSLPIDVLTRDMFSADELLDNGNPRGPIGSYRGYDIHGNLANDKTSFADFWTKLDENGNHTRPIAAFSPIYMAGYVEDKFQLKDLTFRIGLRVDRYDANQMVLRDMFSIVGSQTVGESRNKVTGNIPSNIGDDYVIYVDKQKNPKVLGFRNGNTWYSIEGQELASYNALAGSPVPLLPEGQSKKTNDIDFKPELAFEKYKAQYNFMPRLQFSFNISDNALFFAHYDVLSMSPQSRISGGFFTNRSIGSPRDYYFYDGGTISNPNLKAETTIDFQLGFKQKLNKTSALTFSAYFKEFKNQIQVRRVDGVFPNPSTYYTYDNIDFGNTKGFEFGYEMRRTNNLKLNFNYTLQFADGTGSDDRTQLTVVRGSEENFRNVAPLDFDSRHSLNLVIDYRFGEGDDYNGPVTKKGGEILSNFGVNLLTQLNSGTPYTKQANATNERAVSSITSTSEGRINGARLGWSIDMDLKLNKSFGIALKSKKEDAKETRLNFDVYLRVDNILGIANITSVYKFSGSAADDGWLGSPQGNVAITTAQNSDSYKDLYEAGLNTPGNYSAPRRIFIGASVYF